MNENTSKRPALINSILMLHGLAILILLAYLGKSLFIPLFFSFLISVFLYPFCRWLEKHSLPRGVSSAICILLFLLSLTVIVYFVGAQFQRFLKDIPSLKERSQVMIKTSQVWLKEHYNISDDAQTNYINKSLDGIISAIGFTITGSLTLVVFITLSIFFTFYMLLYRRVLKNFILFFFSKNNKQLIAEISSTLNTTIVNYIKGLLIEMFILIILSSITLLILGIKYAILMAFVASIFNIIPYIGIYSAALINMLITVVDGNGKQSVEVLLVFVIIHVIDANVIIPFIVGKRIKINPLVTLIAVISGELIWGIPGMFLFIPLAAIINIIIEKTTGINSELKSIA